LNLPLPNPGIATILKYLFHFRDGVTGACLRTSINGVRFIHTN
jgi:hypothetical protein